MTLEPPIALNFNSRGDWENANTGEGTNHKLDKRGASNRHQRVYLTMFHICSTFHEIHEIRVKFQYQFLIQNLNLIFLEDLG